MLFPLTIHSKCGASESSKENSLALSRTKRRNVSSIRASTLNNTIQFINQPTISVSGIIESTDVIWNPRQPVYFYTMNTTSSDIRITDNTSQTG